MVLIFCQILCENFVQNVFSFKIWYCVYSWTTTSGWNRQTGSELKIVGFITDQTYAEIFTVLGRIKFWVISQSSEASDVVH